MFLESQRWKWFIYDLELTWQKKEPAVHTDPTRFTFDLWKGKNLDLSITWSYVLVPHRIWMCEFCVSWWVIAETEKCHFNIDLREQICGLRRERHISGGERKWKFRVHSHSRCKDCVLIFHFWFDHFPSGDHSLVGSSCLLVLATLKWILLEIWTLMRYIFVIPIIITVNSLVKSLHI